MAVNLFNITRLTGQILLASFRIIFLKNLALDVSFVYKQTIPFVAKYNGYDTRLCMD
jgi:hypothetical protein